MKDKKTKGGKTGTRRGAPKDRSASSREKRRQAERFADAQALADRATGLGARGGFFVPAHEMAAAMIERLEQKRAAGATGWEQMKAPEIINRLAKNQQEILDIAAAPPTIKRISELRLKAVDAANLAFFLWHNLEGF